MHGWGPKHLQWIQRISSTVRSTAPHDVSVVLDRCGGAANGLNIVRLASFFNCKSVIFHGGPDPSSAAHIGSPQEWWTDLTQSSGLPTTEFTKTYPVDDERVVVALEHNGPTNAIPLNQFEWPVNQAGDPSFVLLLGHESEGISDDLLKKADHLVTIEQHGSGRSLNVATAAGVALHDAIAKSHEPIATKKPSITLKPSGSSNKQEKITSATALSVRRREMWRGPSDVLMEAVQHQVLNPTLRPGNAHEDTTPTNVADAFRGLTLKQVRERLEAQRGYQVEFGALLEHGVNGDRNLGGLVRNAACFNAAAVLYTGRRKFDRRSAVGAHNVVSLVHVGEQGPEALRHLAREALLVSLELHTHTLDMSDNIGVASDWLWSVECQLQQFEQMAQQSHKPILLVLPEEGMELSPGMKAMCQANVRLLPAGEFCAGGGLPTSVSAAILMRRLAQL